MTCLRHCGTFLKRKTTWFALAVGVLVGVFFWWRLPINHQELVNNLDHLEELNISRDGKYLAAAGRAGEDKAFKIHLWDVSKATRIADISLGISTPSPVGPSFAFAPAGKSFLLYNLGQVRCWDLGCGTETTAPNEHRFDQYFDGWSRLITDSKGDLFVLFDKEFVHQVWDFNSGQEVYSTRRWGRTGLSRVFAGGIISKQGNRITVRNLPNLSVRGHVQLPRDKRFGLKRPPPIELEMALSLSREIDPNLALTPDCQNLVFTDGKIYIWDVTTGEERILDRQANAHPTLTPDGKLLAVQIKNWVRVQTWFNKMEDFLGIGSKPTKGNKAVILYELSSADEVGFIADATNPRFSPDGKTLVIQQDGALHIYDMPFRKPWGKILLFAMMGATPILLLGQVAAFRKRKRARSDESNHVAGGER